MTNPGIPAAGKRRRPLRDVLFACILVLILAQGLIGSLSLSALNRLALDNTAQRVELLARQTSGQIQTGLDLGKPLAQFFGLSTMLEDLPAKLRDLAGASVVLADGHVLASVGAPPAPSGLLASLHTDASRALRRAEAETVTVAVPLIQPAGTVAGALLLQVHVTGMERNTLVVENLWVLASSTLIAAIALALLFRFAMPLHQIAAAGRLRMLVPLLVLLVAQGAYAAFTIHTFREEWVDVTRDNTRILGEGLQKDLDRLLGYGIAPNQLRGVEKPMARLAAAFPAIAEMNLVDAGGGLLNRANAAGPLSADISLEQGDDVLGFPLRAGSQGPELAQLQIRLDRDFIAAGVRARILDAATVAAVALVAAVELLLLLSLLMNRAFAVRSSRAGPELAGLDDQTEVGKVVRPVMFGFLFAVALPLSFLPIQARSLLPEGGMAEGAALLMALPIAAEMGCGLLTALLAGRLTDRRGWHIPVLAGLLVSVAGNLACALADSLLTFTMARAMVGLGYGLAWMGLQGFIVIRSPAAYRGRNMALIIAGLFAGHLSGAAVGAMLVQQIGPSGVFLVGAGLLVLPAIGVLTLLWPYRSRGGEHAPGFVAAAGVRSWAALRNLLSTRDFGMLLAGCVIPFSIAQVGLLTYALPLYLEAYGATAASVGRILMLYGFCVIYAGPYMGRLADRSRNKKAWIVAGGLVGSAGLLGLHFFSGVTAAAVAVVLLALASCLAGGAQTAYMLALDSVQDYGPGGATSIMRGADKFGQMLGPLMVGGLFASVGMSGGLVVTGAIYLVATLAFLRWAPKAAVRRRPAVELAP